jgi:RHS repeat-associated protein
MLSGHDFYPFGMEVAESGQAAGGPSRMKFTGHERDDLTGLDYMKARYSGWFQASFLIPDPAIDVNPRNPQSWNRYAYVRNDPMNLIDPDGLEGKKIESYLHDGERDRTGGELAVIGIDANSRGLDIDDGSKKADEANRKEGGEDPAAAETVARDSTTEPISRGGNAILTDTEIGNIVFNETRSLSGAGIDDARRAIANIVINGDESAGANRPVTASTRLPRRVSEAEQSTLESIREIVTTVRTERAAGSDSSNGAMYFGFRDVGRFRSGYEGLATVRRFRTQSPIRNGVVGPFENSYPTPSLGPSGIYFVPFR